MSYVLKNSPFVYCFEISVVLTKVFCEILDFYPLFFIPTWRSYYLPIPFLSLSFLFPLFFIKLNGTPLIIHASLVAVLSQFSWNISNNQTVSVSLRMRIMFLCVSLVANCPTFIIKFFFSLRSSKSPRISKRKGCIW